MVLAADCPEEGVGRGSGRAVDTDDTGSAFDEGQSPRGAFFRGPHPPWSLFVAGIELSPLVCGVCAEPEEVVDKVDDEDAEPEKFWR